jgi:hypothetical protein
MGNEAPGTTQMTANQTLWGAAWRITVWTVAAGTLALDLCSIVRNSVSEGYYGNVLWAPLHLICGAVLVMTSLVVVVVLGAAWLGRRS